MSFKETILKNCQHELSTCQHLYTKLNKKDQNWRPAENIRSTIELMQYLTYIGWSLMEHYVHTPNDGSGMERHVGASQAASGITFEMFPQAIEDEKSKINDLMKNLTDEDLLNRQTYHPWDPKHPLSLGAALMRISAILTAYRHQLFLYAKMCGAEVNTTNNWAGMDPAPRPAPKAEATA